MTDKQWSAEWIWGEGEISPRNEWRCFRRVFDAPQSFRTLKMHISADSRYVLYVNGQQVGRGPVRSWPEQQFFDTHDIAHLIRPGERNAIAVHVLHWGVSNFYYLRGRGGLLAELEWDSAVPASFALGTDPSWRTSRLAAHDSSSPRMSCQQGFADLYDANRWDESWTAPEYDDSDWRQAVTVGPVGSGPWTRLIPRDIPFLTEEKMLPARLTSLHKVKPAAWTAAIDLRNAMVPESAEHANPIRFAGYLATILTLQEETAVTVGFPGGARTEHLWIGGEAVSAWYGEQPERYCDIRLPAGEHLVLIDVTSSDHGGAFHLAVNADRPFGLRYPLGGEGEDGVPIAIVGPFHSTMFIDHQPYEELNRSHPAFIALKGAADIAALLAHREWVHPLPSVMYTEQDAFGASVWHPLREKYAVPAGLQRSLMTVPEPGIVPLFEDGSDTEMIIDFGRELSAFVGFELDAAEGTVIDLYGVEYVKDDYIQHTYWLDNTIRYIAREGRQTYLSPVRRGFRYLIVTVRNASRPVKVHEVYANQSNYPVTDAGTFRCSDPLLNDIWEISKHTTRLCMEDTFVDCPAYEQVFWVGDSRNEALVNYYTFGALDIVERCLRLVPGSSGITPLLLDQVPSGWNSVIPNWTFFWAAACAEYAEHTGDTAFARDIWPAVRSALGSYLERINADGLLEIRGWNLLDWAPIDQPGDGVVAHQNFILVKTLRQAAGLAAMAQVHGADADPEANRFLAAAASLEAAINRHLWSEEKNAFIDCIHADGRRSDSLSMQTQVIAYLSGAVGGDRAATIESYLRTPPAEFVQIGSPFMSFFYYEALERLNGTKLIVDDIRHYYGMMVRHGATTCWEMYPNFKENRANPNQLTRSHCHAWSAAPAYFLGRNLLGVKRGSVGWASVTVEPDVEQAGVTWARGSVPLPQGGQIDVAWELEDGGLALSVSAPEGVEVNVKTPEGIEAKVALQVTKRL